MKTWDIIIRTDRHSGHGKPHNVDFTFDGQAMGLVRYRTMKDAREYVKREKERLYNVRRWLRQMVDDPPSPLYYAPTWAREALAALPQENLQIGSAITKPRGLT